MDPEELDLVDIDADRFQIAYESAGVLIPHCSPYIREWTQERSRPKDDPEPFQRMVRAMLRTQRWLAGQSAAGLAAAVAGFFPDLDPGVLERSLERYKGQGVWAEDPRLSQEGFERLQRALLGCGFISRAVRFAECVDLRLADAAVAAP